MAERVRGRPIDDDEGQRLLRIIRRGTGSAVTWRRAQMVVLSAQGMEVNKIAKSKPAEHGLPSSTWSLTKLADFLVAEGVVDDISREGLTWKTSRDPDTDRDHMRQLPPAPDQQDRQASRRVGTGQQRRDRIHPDQTHPG
jgi:hypothetical protein